jgi:hypothetical protein
MISCASHASANIRYSTNASYLYKPPYRLCGLFRFDFDRIYETWWDYAMRSKAKLAVDRSLRRRYIATVEDYLDIYGDFFRMDGRKVR